MSSFVELLLETAKADTDLLIMSDAEGDVLAMPRQVEFVIFAPDAHQAEIIAGFVNDNRYGQATAFQADGHHSVRILIDMPITQNVLCSVSGLMACISRIFGGDYDGWSSPVQRCLPPS